MRHMYEPFNHRNDTGGLMWWILGLIVTMFAHINGVF